MKLIELLRADDLEQLLEEAIQDKKWDAAFKIKFEQQKRRIKAAQSDCNPHEAVGRG